MLLVLIFPLLCSCAQRGVDRSLVAEAVEDAEGKGGVPEYLCSKSISIASQSTRVHCDAVAIQAAGNGDRIWAMLTCAKKGRGGIWTLTYVDSGRGRHWVRNRRGLATASDTGREGRKEKDGQLISIDPGWKGPSRRGNLVG